MRKIKSKKIFLFSVFSVVHFLFCFSSASAQNKLAIRVLPETVIENDRIELGEIARISGEAGKVERLKKTSLGYAPNVGMTREIFRPQILLAISAAGFSENEIFLDAPSKIFVRRAAQEITNDQIREAVEKSVLSRISSDAVEARIVRLDLPGKIQVAAGEVEIRVNSAGVQNLFAPFSLPVEIRVDHKTVRRLAVNIEIEAHAEILVAAKDFPANSQLSESDARLEKRRINKPMTKYLREAKNLRGAVLLKSISNGAEITTDAVTAGYVIKTGDLVQIRAQSGALKIIVKGEARNSGKIGDRISVKNLQSGAILQGVVIDESSVKISF